MLCLFIFLLLIQFNSSIIKISLKPVAYDPFSFKYISLSEAKKSLRNFYNMQYIGTISIGSQKQTFRTLFDTGSTVFWIVGKECKNCPTAKSLFTCESSSTCQSFKTQKETIKYGKGTVAGYYAVDNAYLDPLSVTQQKMLIVTTQLDLDGFQADSIMGMGFTTDPNDSKSFVTCLKNQGKINEKVFSFYLSDQDNKNWEYSSQLIIGGVDHTLFKNEIKYYNVIDNYYWAILMEKAKVDGKVLNSGPVKVLLDTGTSFLTIPKKEFFDIINYITSSYSHKCSVVLNQYICDCYQGILRFPTLSFYFGDNFEYKLEPSDYVQYQNGVCYLLMSIENNMNMWILGDVFLRKYYSVYNLDTKQIGVAEAIHPEKQFINWKFVIFLSIVGGIILCIALVFSIKWILKKRRNRVNTRNEIQRPLYSAY